MTHWNAIPRLPYLKPIVKTIRSIARRACPRWLLVALLSSLPLATLRAGLAEPDYRLYGLITLDNRLVGAARTDVVIEARRVLNGPPIASYRMGSISRLGDFYSLRIAVESLPPLTNPDASQTGDDLIVVVTDASGVRSQAAHSVGERGTVQRIDFGTAVPDGDGDGLPDAWELLHFTGTGMGPGDIAANGLTLADNYIAGTDPNDPEDWFLVNVTLSDGNTVVSFPALRAEGTGYEGRTRYYSLEFAPALGEDWEGVPDYTDLIGDNQTVVFETPASNAPGFYRGTVRLTQP